jgi:hypothetical protein
MSDTPQYSHIMLPLQLPKDSGKKEDKPKTDCSIVGMFLWALVLLFFFWYIVGGYKTMY